MAKKQGFTADHAEFRRLLRGPECAGMVRETAQKIAAAAPHDGIRGYVWMGDSRVVGIVQTVNKDAAAYNSRTNAILRAIQAGHIR